MLNQTYSIDSASPVKNFFNNVIKFRYAIALVAFVLLVVFKINGSNINYWKNYIDESGQSTTVSGEAKGIRSDEWEVLIPIYLSQQNSDTPFSIVNPDITLSGQNAVITLGAPIKDVYVISKPLLWGFLFLNADYAISWYWDLKIILILLLAFELCMILTRQNKLISVLGSLWIAFSPAVQWWFAQHVGDNVLYLMAIVVTFYYFFKFFDKLFLKIIFAFLFSLSCLGFLIPLYPAVQIPFGFLSIILMILIFTDFRKKIRIRKFDAVIIGVTAVFTLAMLGHLYLIIKDAIPLMKNTVYPGQRISTGGSSRKYLFYSFMSNIWLPYKNVGVQNACELSSFYNFLPAVLLALPVLIHRRTKSLRYGISLAVYSSFFALYMAFSFVPKSIAKITLLSYVTDSRAMIAYAFSAMLLSIWALSELSRQGGVKRIYAALVSLAVGATYLVTIEFAGLKGSMRLRYYLALILIFTLLNYLLLRGRERSFAAIMACVIAASGLTVNPINIGAGAILNNTLSREIREVDKSDNGAVWMSVDSSAEQLAVTGVLTYANGAKSIGGINNYPDAAKWSILDPQGKYSNIYNRSAHVLYQIVKTKTNFVLESCNVVLVNINENDLEKLNVKYIVSDKNLTALNENNIKFKELYAPDGNNYTIYQVSYSR